jgi:hypothetical protein
MPVWGWILLIAGLSGLLVAGLAAVVRGAHELPSRTPLHTDPDDFAAPVPLDLAEADSRLAREPEAERRESPAGLSPRR